MTVFIRFIDFPINFSFVVSNHGSFREEWQRVVSVFVIFKRYNKITRITRIAIFNVFDSSQEIRRLIEFDASGFYIQLVFFFTNR